ncbi:MAG: Imidazolonepropionase [Candidatus Aminicenantes bacterium ADurb.Bin147]|nr:imidazolonepropionase [Acidobacteriota bacterium]MDD8039550.1 imidazolonepropionase [Acidobacteriota bacterium]OQB55069.1 MAG: Imidazolonepropionase [Candidatus Aminicenantes bacterium ADurb.Bin147]
MIKADCVVAGCRALATCRGPIPKRREALQDAGVIENAWLAGRGGRIVFVGPEDEFRRTVRPEAGAAVIDARGLVGFPGFVDAHTHLPFAGSRGDEFSLRLQGWTYQQLAARGMGIRSTVRATRSATREELRDLCLARLDEMLLHGTTTAEAKSGYGLNREDEIKQLEAVRDADALHPVDLIPTFMGAHEIPDEFRDRKEDYLDLLIHTVMPAVRDQSLARFFDVFCEEGVFSLDETKRLAEAALSAGFGLKIHADEFVPLGGTELAARKGAVSAEHLIAITESGIAALAGSVTAAILLPNVPFFLMQDKRAPARRLIDAGAVVALASDFNPGSSMTSNMQWIIQLGVFQMRMTIEEALNAATANGAYAIREHEDRGSLEPGKFLDLVLCDMTTPADLVYHVGRNPVKFVLKKGKVVVSGGRIVRGDRADSSP